MCVKCSVRGINGHAGGSNRQMRKNAKRFAFNAMGQAVGSMGDMAYESATGFVLLFDGGRTFFPQSEPGLLLHGNTHGEHRERSSRVLQRRKERQQNYL